MTSLTYEEIIEDLVLPEERDEIELGLDCELQPMALPFKYGEFERVVDWPLGLGPRGPLVAETVGW